MQLSESVKNSVNFKLIFFSINLLYAHLQYVCNISAKCWKDLMKSLGGFDFTKYVLSVIIQTSYCKITKWQNSCNNDPSAPIFLQNMHCLMVMVWCKFEQNWTKVIKVIEQKAQMLKESWNHRMTDMLETVYPAKTLFCWKYNYKEAKLL